jgi:hypothetical protein
MLIPASSFNDYGPREIAGREIHRRRLPSSSKPDYNGDPVQGSFRMSEDLTRLWTSGQAGPPNPNSWPENGPLFTDWIGFQGNFTPSSQAYFMNWQSFSTNWGNAGWYHLSTQIIQVANMIAGLLTTAEPTVIWP